MRSPLLLVFLCATLITPLAVAPTASAQVSDAERAAARALFKDGDELQRVGKFAEALDKFQRAQQIFSAPTNLLRIAECDAALGHLVESAESYRTVVRTPLPAGSPPAFQAAVDQARGELAQVEPRVPKVVVQVDPPNVPAPQLQIDGQQVPAAILGEPLPLDPGTHKVLVTASGFAGAEQSVTLKERDSKTVTVALRAIPGVTYSSGSPPPAGAMPPPPAAYGAVGEGPGMPPPPPPVGEAPVPNGPRPSRVGILLGAHLGLDIPAGQVEAPGGSSVDLSSVSGSGAAFALDGGLRFARQWYVGLTFEHAILGQGHDPSAVGAASGSLSSNTTTAGAVIGLIVNPDRTSFFGELGAQYRWYDVTYSAAGGTKVPASYSAGEFLMGLGIWIPIGHSFRLLPEATAGLGAFGPPNVSGNPNLTSSATTSESPGHGFVMLGVAGFYNIDL
ncbi:MAG TPA: hypothetical protein VGG39_20895 [Polyangiaceae bacterium]|jgi:hypothetical protein